jgi:hypothetical protein
MSPTVLQSVPASAVLYPVGVWVVMAVVAVLNGVFRETVIIPRAGVYPGHVISTVLLVAAILVVSGLYFANAPVEYARAELLVVGAGWTVLTVGFEFLVGHLEGAPPSETIAQYDVLSGQVWILVPLTLLLAPLVFGWLLEG